MEPEVQRFLEEEDKAEAMETGEGYSVESFSIILVSG